MNFTGSETTTNISGFNIMSMQYNVNKPLQKSSSYWYCLANFDDVYKSSDLDTWTGLGLSSYDDPFYYQTFATNKKSFYVENDNSIHVAEIGYYYEFDYIHFTLNEYYSVRYSYYDGNSWTYTNLPWTSTTAITDISLAVDSTGVVYIVLSYFAVSGIGSFLKCNIKTSSWSGWNNIPKTYSILWSLVDLVVGSDDKVYCLIEDLPTIASNVSTECLVYSGSSWSSAYVGSHRAITGHSAIVGSNIYFLCIQFDEVYLLYGNSSGFTKSTLKYDVNLEPRLCCICYDGTNIHCIYGYYSSGTLYVKYIYGTIGSFTSEIEMVNLDAINGYTPGFYGDAYRLVYLISDANGSYRYYTYVGDKNAATQPTEPTTSGGRFYYYNSTQSTFKLARNIKYNDSGTYKIGRKFLDYGSEDGWKRVRF